MDIVTANPQSVKTNFIDMYTEIVFDDMIDAASASFIEVQAAHDWKLSWPVFVTTFRSGYEKLYKVDLSEFPIPPAPQIEVGDDFDQWVDQMEAEFGDMADATTANQTGIPMF